MSFQPLTDEELAFGCDESPQALHQLKLSYRKLRTAYEEQSAELRAALSGVGAGKSQDCKPPPLDWLIRHLQTCRDQSCAGCKKCRRCGVLTLAYGFEDHLCYNCRNPPSD